MRPPICEPCFKKFLKAFRAVNKHTPAEQRESLTQLEDRAARRGQAVKFGGEWICPRCTKLENGLAQQILLAEAYPNRDARRKAVKASKRRNDGQRKGT